MLGVFAKLPSISPVKTRLQARLARADAERLCLAMLADTLETACRVVERPVLFLAPPGPSEPAPPARTELAARAGALLLAAGLAPESWDRLQVEFQRGIDLGARLEAAFTVLCGVPPRPALVIGADSPSLPPSLLENGLAELASSDVVLGPTVDGGYWAIGLRAPGPGLLKGVPWSTTRTLEATRARALERGLRVALLPLWNDVDEPADLLLLAADIGALRSGGDATTARHSEQALRALALVDDGERGIGRAQLPRGGSANISS